MSISYCWANGITKANILNTIYSETRLYKIRRESKNEFEIAEVYHNRGCLTRKSPSSYPKESNFELQYIRVFTITEFYITEFYITEFHCMSIRLCNDFRLNM